MSQNQSGLRAALVLGLLLLSSSALAAETPREVHGENSVFAGNGVAMAWGILREASEEKTQVVVRIVNVGQAYTYLHIDGVDPFTQERKEMLSGQPLGDNLEVRSPRASFAEFTRREFQFYTTDDWLAKRPSLTVYYMGVPDTSPEVASEAPLGKYLDDALAKVRGQAQGQTP